MTGLDELGLDHRFLIAEWEQVVLARDINTLPEYAMTPRPGTRRRLSRGAAQAGLVARSSGSPPSSQRASARPRCRSPAWPPSSSPAATAAGLYAHAVVDEAQDLHPAQWRLLRACVPPGPNDLFLAGDAHQRIYDHRVSLSSLGIETRGRSRRLKINYRTSQSILADRAGHPARRAVDDLDGELEADVGYRSAFDGPAPRPRGSPPRPRRPSTSPTSCADGSPPASAHRRSASLGAPARLLKPVQEALTPRAASSGASSTTTSRPGTCASRRCTPPRAWSSRAWPSRRQRRRGSATDRRHAEAEDKLQHDFDVLRERCLLYVACTRARDELVLTGSGAPSTLLPDPERARRWRRKCGSADTLPPWPRICSSSATGMP